MRIIKRLIPLTFFLIAHSLIAQTIQKTVTAVSGDGIHSLLRKNGLEPISYEKEFIALNSSKLGPNNGLLIGKSYILPGVKKDSTDNAGKSSAYGEHFIHPIFGENYDSVIVGNKKLNGAIYYLVSGHGGPDPGATVTYNNKLISEDEYAYDVNLRLARMLISYGAKVYMIIKDPNDGIRDQRILEVDYDEVTFFGNAIPRSQNQRLRQRIKEVNNLYAKHQGAYQRLIVTHVDSRSKGENIDVFFYHHHKSKSGKRLAENIHNSFKEKYALYQPHRRYSGSISSRNLALINKTSPAMVYVELGNISSAKDQRRILNYENRAALAKWILNGLVIDFEESY